LRDALANGVLAGEAAVVEYGLILFQQGGEAGFWLGLRAEGTGG
jgi:hypothetical protein